MRLDIIRGFLHPHDLARKGQRRALVLGEDPEEPGVRVVAPATTYFARKGAIPPGHVLITPGNCPGFARTGFDVDRVLISIRDAVRVHKDSPWLRGAEKIGVLDLDLAPRVLSLIGESIMDFPVRDRVYY